MLFSQHARAYQKSSQRVGSESKGLIQVRERRGDTTRKDGRADWSNGKSITKRYINARTKAKPIGESKRTKRCNRGDEEWDHKDTSELDPVAIISTTSSALRIGRSIMTRELVTDSKLFFSSKKVPVRRTCAYRHKKPCLLLTTSSALRKADLSNQERLWLVWLKAVRNATLSIHNTRFITKAYAFTN